MKKEIVLKFGVPCSRIKDKINDVNVPCANEEQAFGLAAGCILAGKKPIVYLQTSGLGRCIDILTSLYLPYKIPYPNLILSVRTSPKHHYYIFKITKPLLKMLRYSSSKIDFVLQEE